MQMKKQIEVVKKVWEPYKKIMQIKEKKLEVVHYLYEQVSTQVL
jgi:hypothetical protein